MKNRFLSLVLSVTVLASTIVGAFAVNFSKASALKGSDIHIYTLQNRVEQHFSNTTITNFFQYVENHYNDDGWLIMACIDEENDYKTAITVWDISFGSPAHPDGFFFDTNGVIRRNASAVGYLWKVKAFFYSDSSTQYYCQYNISGGDMYNSAYAHFAFGNNPYEGGRYVFPNEWNILSTPLTSYFSVRCYYMMSTSDYLEKNLYRSPVSAFDNILIQQSGRYYFTWSDNYCIRDVYNTNPDAEIVVTFEKEDGTTFVYSNYALDFTYMALYSYPDVTNISPNGLLVWDVTDIISAWRPVAIVFSTVSPVSLDEDYFASNRVSIALEPEYNPWDDYYDYLNKWNDALNYNPVIPSEDLPSWIKNSTNLGFGVNSNIWFCTDYNEASTFATVHFPLNYLEVLPESIIVCSERLFLNVGDYDLPAYSDYNFHKFFYNIWNTVDMIVVLSDDDWDGLFESYNEDTAKTEFDPSLAEMWQLNTHYFWYDDNILGIANVGQWFVIDGVSQDNSHFNEYAGDRNCYCFATQYYLQRINNHVLAEGFTVLEDALNSMNDNLNGYFPQVVSGIGTTFASIQTANGYLDKIYKSLNFDILGRLDTIVDKLETLVYNTDEQEHGFWILSVYDFINQFVPSMEGFSNWIGAIEDFGDSLPEIPVITVPALPTSVPEIGGG